MLGSVLLSAGPIWLGSIEEENLQEVLGWRYRQEPSDAQVGGGVERRGTDNNRELSAMVRVCGDVKNVCVEEEEEWWLLLVTRPKL